MDSDWQCLDRSMHSLQCSGFVNFLIFISSEAKHVFVNGQENIFYQHKYDQGCTSSTMATRSCLRLEELEPMFQRRVRFVVCGSNRLILFGIFLGITNTLTFTGWGLTVVPLPKLCARHHGRHFLFGLWAIQVTQWRSVKSKSQQSRECWRSSPTTPSVSSRWPNTHHYPNPNEKWVSDRPEDYHHQRHHHHQHFHSSPSLLKNERWVCTSGRPEDLATTDRLAKEVLEQQVAEQDADDNHDDVDNIVPYCWCVRLRT